jgi:hypothetical protein
MPAGPPVLEEPKFVVARPDADSEGIGTGGRPKSKRAAGGAAAAAAEAKPVGSAGAGGPTQSGRLKPGEALTPVAPAEQDESVRSGKEKQPGRILHVRGVPR